MYRKYKNFTMIPRSVFAGNLELCEEFSYLKGQVVECGVWRGGMIAAIAEILGKDRNYLLFDSFEGLPKARDIDGKVALAWQNDTKSPVYFDNCKAEINFSQQAMMLAHASRFKIIKGWFSQTLSNYPFKENIAILRLDADWYDSTMDCLIHLYPHVCDGGLIIIDDYYTWEGCSKAVHDYLSKNLLSDRIRQTKYGICYITKTIE